ncbi:hypothetical protein D8I35_00655 [Corticibacter populi]|uniref:Uncharacterized protein n=2 Tax=Corticibacter populi TaxID=1550736 RepID=A0A3M6QXF1_9BURK|nr:hypothetical protein D8I35_00655 [Corticibacter populi]
MPDMQAEPTQPQAGDATLAGPAQWQAALLACIGAAAAAPESPLVFCSPRFADWPLSQTPVLQALQHWAGRNRRLVLIANEFDTLVRQQPRFLAWRQQWDAIITGRKVMRSFQNDTPSFAWCPAYSVWLTNAERLRGIAGTDAAWRSQLAELVDEWRERRSVNGFAASTLGL